MNDALQSRFRRGSLGVGILLLAALVLAEFLPSEVVASDPRAGGRLERIALQEECSPGSRAGGAPASADYEANLTFILREIVAGNGRVRYGILRDGLRDPFRGVLRAIEDTDLSSLTTEQEKLAFWINAYNVQMLQNVVEHPEAKNPWQDDLVDAFFHTCVRTAQNAVTLYEIEHVILRDMPGRDALRWLRLGRLDPRIHVVLHCAAISCPSLRRTAFTPNNLEEELDSAMREFTADPRHFRTNGRRVVVSSLLDWFGDDFEKSGLHAGDFLLRYMPPSRPDYARLKRFFEGRRAVDLRSHPLVQFEYDWSINSTN